MLIAILLLATGRDPASTYKDLFEAAFTAPGALSQTLTGATPILFTGLAAAAAFRMNLFNIGGEGQLYFGAIACLGSGPPPRGPVGAGADRGHDGRRASRPAQPGR